MFSKVGTQIGRIGGYVRPPSVLGFEAKTTCGMPSLWR
jgi:hypothetical protein